MDRHSLQQAPTPVISVAASKSSIRAPGHAGRRAIASIVRMPRAAFRNCRKSRIATRRRASAGVPHSIWLLSCCQALNLTIVIVQVMASSLVGHMLAPDKALVSLPAALQMTATMAAALPAGLVFTRLGRLSGFLLGTAASMTGCLVLAAAVWKADFTLYCLGTVPLGLGTGIAQHLRFAAAEIASPALRARAVARVMAGGLLAAVGGPELAKATMDLFAPSLFLGTYLCLAGLPVVAALLLGCANLPSPSPRSTAPPDPVSSLARNPDFLVAAIAGLMAYGSMYLVTTSMPLQMVLCGFGAGDSANVLGVHSLAMYGPGLFSGRLIERFGARWMVCAGGVLSIVSVAMSLCGVSYPIFVVAMALLGLGWSLMFTGATTLLVAANDAAERMVAQAVNDFLVFGTVACATFGSGLLHSTWGWAVVNMAAVPMILIGLVAVLWRWSKGARSGIEQPLLARPALNQTT
jgi:predicted MFS family arabinose efflux permease